MAPQQRIQLVRHRASSRFLSPLAGFSEVKSETERRLDPLTGRVAIVGLNLSGKRSALFSETDTALLEALAEKTREGCFFCPERVEQLTPRYPDDVLGGDGRLRSGDAVLFPNLFPLTEFHAVIALGAGHSLRLDEFTPELVGRGLELGLRFIREVMSTRSEPPFWSICGNYLPPGGASIVHPHLQVLGSGQALSTPAVELERARAYRAETGGCYFEDLVALERGEGERLIAEHGPVTWLAAFAPRGNTELLGVCPDVARLTELTPAHLSGLAKGISQGLSTYQQMGYSTFNLCLYSAPLGDDDPSSRVYASLVSRQSFVEAYRCDDYFLQKMLGTEIVIDSPEEVARLVRQCAR